MPTELTADEITLVTRSGVDQTERLRGLHTFLDQEIRPDAVNSDTTPISEEKFGRVLATDLFQVASPSEHGGLNLDSPSQRVVHEWIAEADPNLWLIWLQHVGVVNLIVNEAADEKPVTSRLREQILSGELLAGAALSDIRHYPEKYILAERSEEGWSLSGRISWFSGWGLNGAILLAAATPDGQVVTSLLRLDQGASEVDLGLVFAHGSRTVGVDLNHAHVPDADVISVVPLEQWKQNNRGIVANSRPQLYGFATRVISELRDTQVAAAIALADQAAAQLTVLRENAYRVEDSDLPDREPLLIDVRIRSEVFLQRIAQALVVAKAGKALTRNDIASVLSHFATFVQVQGKDVAIQAAQLHKTQTLIS